MSCHQYNQASLTFLEGEILEYFHQSSKLSSSSMCSSSSSSSSMTKDDLKKTIIQLEEQILSANIAKSNCASRWHEKLSLFWKAYETDQLPSSVDLLFVANQNDADQHEAMSKNDCNHCHKVDHFVCDCPRLVNGACPKDCHLFGSKKGQSTIERYLGFNF